MAMLSNIKGSAARPPSPKQTLSDLPDYTYYQGRTFRSKEKVNYKKGKFVPDLVWVREGKREIPNQRDALNIAED